MKAIEWKRLSKQSYIFIACLLGMAFIVSCNKENDDMVENEDLVQILKANKWTTRDASYGEGNDYHAWVDFETTYLFFTSDRAGISYWIQKDYDTDLGNSKRTDYWDFDYTVSGNSVTIVMKGFPTVTYYYQGGYLISSSGETIFSSSPMTSSDQNLLKTLMPQTYTIGNLTCTYYPKTQELQISGNGAMPDYAVGEYRIWENFSIGVLTVEEGVTSIGHHAFYKKNIPTVYLPNSLKKIGAEAFADNQKLTNIYIPINVEEIGNAAFSGCSNLKTVYFNYDANKDAKLFRIGDWAFSGCKISNALRFPNQLEYIGIGAFIGGTFTDIYLGKNIHTIGSYALSGSSSGGSLSINRPIPPATPNGVVSNIERWTLYVPVGCSANYSTLDPWKMFKKINESSSLDNNGK